MSNPFHVGDPVVDLAQGRPMIVLDARLDDRPVLKTLVSIVRYAWRFVS